MENQSQNTNNTIEQMVLFEVNIDFDEASVAWNANKKKLADGMYKYVCPYCSKTGRRCGRNSVTNSDFCKIHTK
uniref:Uncharacterized protein n=1 Tax=viral metagenome TaxID=1070528 RepID=A0A6C0KTN3_9ZZZZ